MLFICILCWLQLTTSCHQVAWPKHKNCLNYLLILYLKRNCFFIISKRINPLLESVNYGNEFNSNANCNSLQAMQYRSIHDFNENVQKTKTATSILIFIDHNHCRLSSLKVFFQLHSIFNKSKMHIMQHSLFYYVFCFNFMQTNCIDWISNFFGFYFGT